MTIAAALIDALPSVPPAQSNWTAVRADRRPPAKKIAFSAGVGLIDEDFDLGESPGQR